VKKVFVDTNVIIDLLADRKPFSKFAVNLFEKANTAAVELYVSSHSLATTYYILKKYNDDKALRKTLGSLLEYLHVIALDKDLLKRGLLSKQKDFEDALQILAAQSVGKMDYIVTRNIKDFKESDIEVLSPEEVLEKV
jgi:predicted nucleic acid-binding protein